MCDGQDAGDYRTVASLDELAGLARMMVLAWPRREGIAEVGACQNWQVSPAVFAVALRTATVVE